MLRYYSISIVLPHYAITTISKFKMRYLFILTAEAWGDIHYYTDIFF